MAAKLTEQDINDRLPPHIKIVEGTFVNTHSNASFVDEEYGTFLAKPKKVLSGLKQHPDRVKATFVIHNKLSVSEIVKRLPNHLKLDVSTYIDTHHKAKFIDSEYGEFWGIVKEVLNGKNKKRYEAGRHMSLEEAKKVLPPHISIDESTYMGASKECIFIDIEHGSWRSRLDRIRDGQNHPKRGHETKKISIESLKERLDKRITIDESTYNGVNYKARFIDSEYGEFWAIVSNILYQGQHHPRRYGKISKGEEALFEYATTISDNVQKGFRPVIQDAQKLEIDVFFENEKLGIEYNGLHWHSTEFKEKEYHFNKRQHFESIGIRLIQIQENEWHSKMTIVKSIINSKLGKLTKKYQARKLTLKDVDSKVAKAFLAVNHLMGPIKSKSIGLFDKDELVSLITYKKYKDGIDISRFCNKLETSVAGGLSRLLKEIERREKPKFIQSFVDLRYGTGDSLISLGFKLQSTTLGWQWTDGRNTYNRLKCKANMDDRGLSEADHAKELGWYRIYDAGQAKFVKEFPLVTPKS